MKVQKNEKVIFIRDDVEELERQQKIKALLNERGYLEGLLHSPSAFEGPQYDDLILDSSSRLKTLQAELQQLESERVAPTSSQDKSQDKKIKAA